LNDITGGNPRSCVCSRSDLLSLRGSREIAMRAGGRTWLFSVSRSVTGRRPPFLNSDEMLRREVPIRRRISSSRSARGLPPSCTEPDLLSEPDSVSGSFVRPPPLRFPFPRCALEEACRRTARHRAWRSDERTKSRCPTTRNRSEVRTRKSSRLLRPGDSSRARKSACARAKNSVDANDREAHAEIQWLAPRCACAIASGALLRAFAKPPSVKMQAPSSMKHEDGADVWKIFARGENPRGGMIRP
jgi:hypothetical protein